jgi:hypothetical protein
MLYAMSSTPALTLYASLTSVLAMTGMITQMMFQMLVWEIVLARTMPALILLYIIMTRSALPVTMMRNVILITILAVMI